MKLLVVTQAVDTKHPILGFFVRWLQEFATKCEHVTVVGQQVGEGGVLGSLQERITVRSLGKERGLPRMAQVLRFWRLLLVHRNEYDAVLVHMTPIWVLLGAPMWVALRKPVYLWYEARGAGWNLRLALPFVSKVFSASPYGMPVATRKSVVVGHGIDTAQFHQAGEPNPHQLMTVGRITAAKRLDVLLEAFMALPATYRFTIAGIAITEADRELQRQLEQRIAQPQFGGRVTLTSIPPHDLPSRLSMCGLFLHAAQTSLDKAVLEAMACGVPVVSCSAATKDVLPPACWSTPEGFMATVRSMLMRSAAERAEIGKQLRKIVVEKHSLPGLVEKLVKEMALSFRA